MSAKPLESLGVEPDARSVERRRNVAQETAQVFIMERPDRNRGRISNKALNQLKPRRGLITERRIDVHADAAADHGRLDNRSRRCEAGYGKVVVRTRDGFGLTLHRYTSCWHRRYVDRLDHVWSVTWSSQTTGGYTG